MKKNLFLVLVGLVLTGTAYAASVALSPISVSVEKGKTFSVTAVVDPAAAKIYTAKIELSYPADVLEVTSFSFASKWMALSQEGYDLVDNAAGSIIKTAGYPGGLSSKQSFGTITFKAKKSGEATIKVSSGTKLFDASSNNVSAGTAQVAVVISAPVVTPTPTPATADEEQASPVVTSTNLGEEVVVTEQASTTEGLEVAGMQEINVNPDGGNSLLAQAFSLMRGWAWYIVIIILVATAYVIGRRSNN
ncbi:MAG: hypothetical protein A2562_00015 [Candidatus Nealsonbacteria bacterium RIFOXYD1_FULL_39_11]|nr:MAG: hypothetical protein A2562_00015 [Candidatus Nealsonbacteria bacterium RIFOXYD1_FULL_39_11]